MTPAPRPAGALLAACLALAWTQALQAQELNLNSPFLANTEAAGPAAAQGDLQLSGITILGGETSVCLVDSALKKSFWVAVGSSERGIEVLSCNPAENRAVVRVRGETRTLVLRSPSKTPGKQAPGTAAAMAPQAPRPAQLPPPVVVGPAPAAQPATGTVPATDIGPAGGQLPPVIPLTTREEQEREARMLVSDLMEIGMRQRKAYEEAQRAAKAEAAAKGGANSVVVPAVPPTTATPPTGR